MRYIVRYNLLPVPIFDASCPRGAWGIGAEGTGTRQHAAIVRWHPAQGRSSHAAATYNGRRPHWHRAPVIHEVPAHDSVRTLPSCRSRSSGRCRWKHLPSFGRLCGGRCGGRWHRFHVAVVGILGLRIDGLWVGGRRIRGRRIAIIGVRIGVFWSVLRVVGIVALTERQVEKLLEQCVKIT